jgi:hypothetical protein
MSRRIFRFFALGAIVFFAGWSIYWFIVARNLRDGVARWQASLPAQGWRLDTHDMAFGGWPLRSALTARDVSLSRASAMSPGATPGGIGVASATVIVSIDLFQPNRLRIDFPDALHVSFHKQPGITVSGKELAAELPLRAVSPVVHVGGADVRLGLAPGDGIIAGSLMSDTEVTQGLARFGITAANVTLPGGVTWALGSHVRSFAVSGTVNGLAALAGTPMAAAAAWRDGGGAVDVSQYKLGWDTLDLTGAGTLRLDDKLQPVGNGTAHVVGYAQTLDRLAATGMLSNSAALAAKAMLTVLSDGKIQTDKKQSGEDGGVDIPISLRNRILSAHQIPLVQTPEVDWSATE